MNIGNRYGICLGISRVLRQGWPMDSIREDALMKPCLNSLRKVAIFKYFGANFSKDNPTSLETNEKQSLGVLEYRNIYIYIYV